MNVEPAIRERIEGIESDLEAVQVELRGFTGWQYQAALRGEKEFGRVRMLVQQRERLTRRKAMLLEAYRGGRA